MRNKILFIFALLTTALFGQIIPGGGIQPVAKGGTGTNNGSITGTGALTFTAGGANQNVTLAPSGTGVMRLYSAGPTIGWVNNSEWTFASSGSEDIAFRYATGGNETKFLPAVGAAGSSVISVRGWNSSTSSPTRISLFNSRGTQAAAVASLTGDNLGQITYGGNKATTTANFSNSATIRALATENYSSTAAGTKLVFATTANTTTTATDNLTIDQDGTLSQANNTAAASVLTGAIKSVGGISTQNEVYASQLNAANSASTATIIRATSINGQDARLQLSQTGQRSWYWYSPASSTNVRLRDASGSVDVLEVSNTTGNLIFTGKISTYNNIAAAGNGVPSIYSAPAISATKTANFTVLTYTPPASAGQYRIDGVITTTSSTNTGTVQFTVDYVDSQGTTHTADVIPLVDAAGAIATTKTGASKEFEMVSRMITTNNAASNIVVKVVITGTVSYTVAATVEKLN